MQTECRNEKLEFQACGARQVVAEFNGGTSDGGVLLLKEVEAKRKIIKQFAACFTDHRDKSCSSKKKRRLEAIKEKGSRRLTRLEP
jgi:Transposase DDE domain group 1